MLKNKPSTDNHQYTLEEIRDYIQSIGGIVNTPEEIFNFWESRNWRTKKNKPIKPISLAVSVANGALNYKKNYEYYKVNESTIAAERRLSKLRSIHQKQSEKTYVTNEKYIEQLKRPEWKSFRQFILTVRGNRCESCGKTGLLHIHHVKYKKNRKAWEYLPSDMLVLCSDCHSSIHGL